MGTKSERGPVQHVEFVLGHLVRSKKRLKALGKLSRNKAVSQLYIGVRARLSNSNQPRSHSGRSFVLLISRGGDLRNNSGVLCDDLEFPLLICKVLGYASPQFRNRAPI